MKLNFAAKDVYCSGENIFGPIYFSCNEFDFPSKGWEDFPISIISNWMRWSLDGDIDDDPKIHLCFFDGSYFIQIEKVNDEISNMHFYNDYVEHIRKYSLYNLKMRDILSLILEAANEATNIPKAILVQGRSSVDDYKSVNQKRK